MPQWERKGEREQNYISQLLLPPNENSNGHEESHSQIKATIDVCDLLVIPRLSGNYLPLTK